MSRKFAIAQKFIQPASTSTAKAVANATPLIHAFCEKIMSHYTGEEAEPLSENEQLVQELFAKWPADDTTKRLAQIVELFTGIKPELVTPGIKFGQLVKIDKKIYVNVWNYNSSASYVLGVDGKSYTTVAPNTDLSAKSFNHVTRAEAGQFCKDFLKVKGLELCTYITGTLGAAGLAAFTKEIGSDVI